MSIGGEQGHEADSQGAVERGPHRHERTRDGKKGHSTS